MRIRKHTWISLLVLCVWVTEGWGEEPALAQVTLSSPSVKTEPSPSPEISPFLEEKRRSQKLVSIRIQGNKNVRERVVFAQIKTRKGEPYDPDSLRRDVQNIYGLGNFEDVALEINDLPSKTGKPGGVEAVFIVAEKPQIKKIDFKGNKKIGKTKLRDTIALKEGDPLDKLKMQLDVEKLLTLYKDQGYAAATVEAFPATDEAKNTATLTFFIAEGKRVLIESVVLEGVRAFKESVIRRKMKTRRKKVFKQETLDKDREEIARYYKNHGHKNIQVREAVQTFNEEKTRLTLTLPIEEGPLFRFHDTTFSGHAIFSSERLASVVPYKKDDLYHQGKLDAAVTKIQDLYGEQGYIRVQVRPEFKDDAAAGTTDIEFKIVEGQVVYVDRISVEGNTHTKDYVIRREVLLKEGDPFNSVKARKSVEKLYNLGFLDNVDVDVQQPSSPDRANVIFTVTEGKPGILSAGAGFSSIDGLIGTMQVQHINFLGRGQRVNVTWEFGRRRQNFDVGWQEPWFLGKPVLLGLNVFNTDRRVSFGTHRDAYETLDQGGSVTLGPRFSEVYTLFLTYSFTRRERKNVVEDPVVRQAVLGDPLLESIRRLTSNVGASLVRDTRDNYFDPNKGTRLSGSVENGGLFPRDAIKFVKPIADASVFFPTFWKFVLSVHGRWSYITPYGDSSRLDIIDELFRVGGPDSVRGYDLGRVGVDPGRAAHFYNVEYKFPIAPDEQGRTILQGAFFYDVGGSWDKIEGVSYEVSDKTTGLKQGAGFGIRFKTPVFPIRLDWGFALNPSPGEDTNQFYFTIGSLF